MSGLGEWFRQRRFPAEFRIAPPAPAAEPAVEPVPEPAPAPPPEAPVVPEPADLTDAAVAEIVTELWRTRRKIDGAGEASRAQRQANRHLLAAWDRFAEAGVKVQGHDGMRFDVGLDLDVLAYQDEPDAARETVLETVRPSVYRGGRRIQIGQVIVAMPEKGSEHDDAS